MHPLLTGSQAQYRSVRVCVVRWAIARRRLWGQRWSKSSTTWSLNGKAWHDST